MELTDRLVKEFEDYKTNLLKKGIENVYNSSYYTALMFELEYVLFHPFEDNNEEEFYVRFGKLDKFKGNICESIIDFYESLRHPERVNFFNSESLGNLIELFIQENIIQRSNNE